MDSECSSGGGRAGMKGLPPARGVRVEAVFGGGQINARNCLPGFGGHDSLRW